MRTVIISGLLGIIAASVFATSAVQAQSRVVSVHSASSGGHHVQGVRPHGVGGDGWHGGRDDHRRHHEVRRYGAGYTGLARDEAGVAVPFATRAGGGEVDGAAQVRAILTGPLGPGAAAAATYILMTQGPKAFGLEDDYKKAMSEVAASEPASLHGVPLAQPKIIRIGK